MRSHRPIISNVVLFFACYLLLMPRIAHAYLDPGTGSLIVQMTVAAVLGVGFALKMYWRKIKSVLGNFLNKKKEKCDGEKDIRQ